MRVAVIDIGSNSTKLILGENCGDEIKIIESLKNILTIGKSTFYKGRISHEILNGIIDVLNNYKKVISQYEVDSVKVIATTAVREADNRGIFVDTIKRKTGFEVEVLNIGDVVYYIDAFLSYKLKKAYPIHEKNLLIAELGAGGFDVSIMERGYTMANIGIPIGTLRLKQFKNRIDGSQKEIYEAVAEHVENEIFILKKYFPKTKIDDVILIDESYSTVLQHLVPNKKRAKSFFKFQLHESKQFLDIITTSNLDDLLHKYDIPTDIAESVDGYAFILNKLFNLIKGKSIYILETSLSEALLANIIFGVELSKKYNKSNQLTSVAKFLCRKYETDYKHAKQVAYLCEEMFKSLKDYLGLHDHDLLYLTMAAYLHNIGLYINNRAHHKHTEYIVSSLNFFRLTDREIKILSCVARYHRKAQPQKTHFLFNTLPPEDQLTVQKLSSILRLANALDNSHKQKVKKLEVNFNKRGEISIVVYGQESFALEKVGFGDMKRLLEEVSGNAVNLNIKRKY